VNRRTSIIVILLLLVPAYVYWPVGGFGFFDLDDDLYVSVNDMVRQGWTWPGFTWAFTNVGYAGNWHPLTWLSLMTDTQFFGVSPGLHHVVNVLVHAANGVLLFVFLRAATGDANRSALVAALFAAHPLHVESVAWIAERKDVLSGFFFALTLLLYVRYARNPALSRYLAMMACFALGLMAKPVLVTLPFLLLLIDAWPLGRLFRPGSSNPPGAPDHTWRLCLAEKVPLLLLSAGASWVTYAAQAKGQLVWLPKATFPLDVRVANALVSYLLYLQKTVWPSGLAFHYPYSGTIRTGAFLTALVLIGLLTGGAILLRRKVPSFPVGWFWFFGTLVPMIGLVQVGLQAMADRYTYLPLTGLFVAAAWVRGYRLPGGERLRAALPPVAVALVVVLAMLARRQVGFWRDGETVYRRSLAVNPDNWLAHNNLAQLYHAQGKTDLAIEHLREALRDRPSVPQARSNLALLLAGAGQVEEAIEQYRRALRESPDTPGINANLADALASCGRNDEALAHLERALGPDAPPGRVHMELAERLISWGRLREAADQLLQAVRLAPRNTEAWNNLGAVVERLGSLEQAAGYYRAALALEPDNTSVALNLAGVLIDVGKNSEAVPLLTKVLERRPDLAEARAELERALSRVGR
jgi:tetratricopeptide (TPR) repeat protein